mgnify:CR=1 FL=1
MATRGSRLSRTSDVGAALDPEGYDEENITGLTAGVEYIVWSVAVDAWGKPQGKFYTDTFTTPTE